MAGSIRVAEVKIRGGDYCIIHSWLALYLLLEPAELGLYSAWTLVDCTYSEVARPRRTEVQLLFATRTTICTSSW